MTTKPTSHKRIIAILTFAATFGAANAAPPIFNGASADSYQTAASAMAANSFGSRSFSFEVPGSNIRNHWWRCYAHAQRDGQNVRGIPITISVSTFNQSGELVDTFDDTKKTNKPNGYAVFNGPMGTPRGEDARLAATIFATGFRKLDRLGLACMARQFKRCTPDEHTLCLNDDRFGVTSQWRSATDEGPGLAMPLGDEEGGFFFDDDALLAITAQVNNQCGNFNHFWVFAAAATDVEYTVTVTDTQTGDVKTYGNELGMAAPAVVDTAAFATCP